MPKYGSDIRFSFTFHPKAYDFGPMRVCGGYVSVRSMSVEGLQNICMPFINPTLYIYYTQVPEATTLYLKGTSSVHQGEFIRVTAECGCDVRPAGSRRLLACRRQVGLALWDDGAPEGTQWRLVAHSLGRGLRP